MNYDQLQKSLLQAARQDAPSAQVPLAFERRVMARLATAPKDLLTEWTAALWQLAVPSLAVAAVACAINFSTPSTLPDDAAVTEVAAADLDSVVAPGGVEATSESW